ncbi:MAG: hypothetical protein EZS28_033410, partial [Streblomastix strix]
GKKAAFYFSAY